MLKYSPIMSTIYNVQFLPPATKLEQGNIFTSVCQEFCPQGGSATNHPLGRDTPGQTPPRSRHPWGGRPPPPRADTPLWEQTAPFPQEQTPPSSTCWEIRAQAGGTHPTGMHTCLCIFLLVDSETQFSVDSA